ncbi:MAG: hypothetical protein ACRD3V_02715 [Vicinamibacteria bacterium]
MTFSSTSSPPIPLPDPKLKDGALSVGDLVVRLDEHLENDDETSRALIPEVWNVARKESAGIEHADQRPQWTRLNPPKVRKEAVAYRPTSSSVVAVTARSR